MKLKITTFLLLMVAYFELKAMDRPIVLKNLAPNEKKEMQERWQQHQKLEKERKEVRSKTYRHHGRIATGQELLPSIPED